MENPKYTRFERLGQLVLVVIVLWVSVVLIARLPLPEWNSPNQAEAAMRLSMKVESALRQQKPKNLTASWVGKHAEHPRFWRRSGNGWSIASEDELLEIGTWNDPSSEGFALVYRGLSPEACQDLVVQLWDAFDQTAINPQLEGEGECNRPLNQVRFYRAL